MFATPVERAALLVPVAAEDVSVDVAIDPDAAVDSDVAVDSDAALALPLPPDDPAEQMLYPPMQLP